MKAFMIAALLVASVASQNMDWTVRDKSMYKFRPTIEELLLKEKMGGRMDTFERSNIFDSMKTSFGVRGMESDNILSIEELISTPLFREYLEIPLFRQFLTQHPTVFRRYVESPLFQKFWTVPEFQMYFRNPIFFYKYIVPQVQLVSETVVPTTEVDYNTPYAYRTRVPEVSSRWSVPMTYGMDKVNFPYTQTTTNVPTTNYRYLLEKMMSHMNINNKPITDTITEVKMFPGGQIKEQTFGKLVDPITGMEKVSVGDIKYVDEKMMPVSSMNFPTNTFGMQNKYENMYNQESVKDALLKHIILSKVLGNRRQIPTEVYSQLFGDNKEIFTPDVYSRIYKHKNMEIPELFDTVFTPKKNVITPEIFETLLKNKNMNVMTPELLENIFAQKMTPEIYELLFSQDNTKVMRPEILENIFGKKVYSPEVYGTLFGGERTLTNNVEFEPLFNKKVMNPLVLRMLKNKVMTPMTLKAIEKYQTEKMIEEITKEKMIKDLPLFTKEHSKIFNNIEMIPKMIENNNRNVFKNVPLTFGKPVVGSNINEFTLEKELF